MSTRKRDSASTSLNQPNHPKRPRDFPNKQQRSRLTEEDVRRVIKEELEHANSHSATYCQRQQRSCLTEEDVRRVIKEELEHAKSHSATYCQR